MADKDNVQKSDYNQFKFNVNIQPGQQANTLDESICDTLIRDLKMIGYKLYYVLIPRLKEDGAKELRNCINQFKRGFMGPSSALLDALHDPGLALLLRGQFDFRHNFHYYVRRISDHNVFSD